MTCDTAEHTISGQKGRIVFVVDCNVVFVQAADHAHLFIQDKLPELVGAFKVVVYNAYKPAFMGDAL